VSDGSGRGHGPTAASTSRKRIRVGLADAHTLLATSLAYCLAQEPDIDVTGVHQTLDGVTLQRSPPDVLIVGYFLMLTKGSEILGDVSPVDPKIIVLTATLDEETLSSCIQFGAVGCVTRDREPRDVADAVRRVHGGEVLFGPDILVRLLRGAGARPPEPEQLASLLAPRELEVLDCLARGLGTTEIARKLVISPHTVRSHLKSALTKLNARSRTEAIARAVTLRLISPLEPYRSDVGSI